MPIRRRGKVIAGFIVVLVLIFSFVSCVLKKGETISGKVSRPLEYHGYTFPEYSGYLKRSEYVVMSDGVKLAVDIFLPSEGPPRDKFPLVFKYTPYSRAFVFPEARLWHRLFARLIFGTPGPVIDITAMDKMVELLLAHGYAFAFVDMRGTGASSGWKFEAMPKYSEDGGELVDWFARQPWCDGNVGMFGRSYLGYAQLATAGQKHPALKCIFPEVTFFNGFSDLVYPGGIYLNLVAEKYIERLERLNLNYYVFNLSALIETMKEKGPPAICLPSAPVVDEDADGRLDDEIPLDLNGNDTFLDDYSFPEDPSDQPRYKDGNPRKHIYYLATKEHEENIDAIDLSSRIFFIDASYPDAPEPYRDINSYDLSPSTYTSAIMESKIAVYNHGGWHDLYSRAHTQIYSTMNRTNPSKMIIDPGFHPGTGPYWEYLGENEEEYLAGLRQERLRFFDRYLKGIENGIDRESPLYLYVQNGGGWRFENEWPLARRVEQDFFFQEGNGLGTEQKAEGTDEYKCDFTHDNRFGKTNGNRWFAGMGILPDVLPVRTEKDKQCLTYTSAPMAEDTEVTGHPIVQFWVSSTADDGDFFVYLVDVEPDGRAVLVTEGMLRAGFAGLYDNDEIIRSGETGVDVKPELPWHGFERDEYDARVFENGKILELKFDLLPTSWVFRKGHLIRVSLACADSPTFRLHPQLAPNNKTIDPENIIPTVNVYRDANHPSRITLPIIPNIKKGTILKN
jgi:putative CocE/NonD family hydrolase